MNLDKPKTRIGSVSNTMANNARRLRQTGATLVISLLMLTVLTLLIVSAMRSSNSNLKIAGNMQVQSEAVAAVQQAIEQVIDVGTNELPTDFTEITAAETINVVIGAATYPVVVSTPTCEFTNPVYNSSLDPSNAQDQLCVGDDDVGDIILDKNGAPIPKATKCNQQQWQVQGTVTDSFSGAQTTLHQGIFKRVYTPTAC